MNTRELIIKHHETYPDLQIQDILKFLHQSCFGCEHMVSSYEKATQMIKYEYNDGIIDKIEALDGNYSRVHLGVLKRISPETFGKLFYLSAKSEADGAVSLETKLHVVRELIAENQLAFTLHEFDKTVSEWKSQGYPALHHSDVFRNAYAPAYRVICNDFLPYLPLLAKIDAADSMKLAIEGGSASGKSTLSKLLSEIYTCTIFHMDDFFLQPHQRTPERFAMPGGNIDKERFLAEVLIPLSQGQPVEYRRFDCSQMKIQEAMLIKPEKLVVIEGAYCMHPELAPYYDFSVFLDISPEMQKERILKRNTPEFAVRFFEEWIPMEHRYFDTFDVKHRCDMCI